MNYVLLWLGIAIAAGVFEMMTVDLVSIWIVVGALVAMILAFFKIPFIYQLIAVLTVSIGLGIVTRPFCKKMLRGNVIRTNADRLIGKTGKITKSFNGDERGELKIGGEYWSCVSKDNQNYNIGDLVTIHAIDGVKLIISLKNN